MALAHEGNPKEDSITIKAGEVLSSATLTVQFAGGSGVAMPIVPPPDNTAAGCVFVSVTRSVDGCPDGYILDAYDDGSIFPVTKLNGTQPFCGTPGALSFFPTSPYWDFSIRSGNTTDNASIMGVFAGFTFWHGIPQASVDMNYLEGNWTVLSGAPRTGFCYWVDPTSTPCNFTAVVLLLDSKAGTTTFGYYLHQDLHSEDPTSLVEIGALPSQGWLLSPLRIDWHTHGAGYNDFILYDPSVTEFLTYNDVSTLQTIITPTENMGIFWAGNSDAGIHAANWDSLSGIVHWEVS